MTSLPAFQPSPAPSSQPEALGGENLAFVEAIYEQYLADPASVDPAWRALFEPISGGSQPIRPGFTPRSIFAGVGGNGHGDGHGNGHANGKTAQVAEAASIRQERLDQLVNAHRALGHLVAQLDPLAAARAPVPELTPAFYGLTDADLDKPVQSHAVKFDGLRTGRDVIEHLKATYCRSIGAQFTHIESATVRRWLQERMESTQNRLRLEHQERVRILTRLTDAETFEQFIQKKFLGAKSFSLEGGESLIPLMDLLIERAAEASGVDEVVIGMAHRGRLNVLANILHKDPRDIFREFEDKDADDYWGRGDVKYHLGRRCDHTTSTGKKVDLTLCFNPSHLEFVSPVVEGRVRGRQDRRPHDERNRVMPVILHGDAAFAGQGIIQELLNMSNLPGYATGGAIHIVVNNQIGFTTPPQSGRSTRYATDVARMLQGPIFHVNGEDPEAVAQVAQLAIDFRARFHEDVVIDLYCYRRHGHNETDEPAYTQPVMYKQIRAKKTVREHYVEHLLGAGLTKAEADRIADERRNHLEAELAQARDKDYKPAKQPTQGGLWQRLTGGPLEHHDPVETKVARVRLQELLEKQGRMPADFHLHQKLEKMVSGRLEMARGEKPLDWGTGEALAFATLLVEGHPVRVSGQDCGRGTFSHRHAVLHDAEDGHTHLPLRHLDPKQAPFTVWDSPLSEAGVLGFDYGYSLEMPDGLVCWEAQFGDFMNGAQVIIDQFISSAEDKWNLLTGLVLLLPHGFEGQGPEHSSARLERFLQQAAEDNMIVANLTTPAQLFHALRRQVKAAWRKPLVLMTPKSLLRHPQCSSPIDELATGRFQPVIGDPQVKDAKRVLLCSGRLYYDLMEGRVARKRDDVAVVRLEQLYPLDVPALEAALAPHPFAPVIWCQEEPRNMGAWYYLRARFGESILGRPLSCVSRAESASPATGSPTAHKREQELLVKQAFGEA